MGDVVLQVLGLGYCGIASIGALYGVLRLFSD